jgi:glycosyltransferase involved in cell wall biosynthesis
MNALGTPDDCSRHAPPVGDRTPCPPPLISIVIPAFNAAGHVGAALASVAGQQGGFGLEVIVVDDGSTDATTERVRDFATADAGSGAPFEIRLLAQANAGPAAARNRGIRAATGEWVAFLDADDLWPADRLRSQVPILAAHPEAVLVFGDCRGFDERGESALTQFESEGLGVVLADHPTLVRDPYPRLLAHNFIPTGSVLARRDRLFAAGLFDESRRLVEDLDLWLRMALLGPMAYTRAVCELKRTHGGNVSADQDAMSLAYIEVLRAQSRTRGDALRRRGLGVGSLIAQEYCLLGDRRERRGDHQGARRAYTAAWRCHPAVRPLYYWLRSWLRRPAETAPATGPATGTHPQRPG